MFQAVLPIAAPWSGKQVPYTFKIRPNTGLPDLTYHELGLGCWLPKKEGWPQKERRVLNPHVNTE